MRIKLSTIPQKEKKRKEKIIESYCNQGMNKAFQPMKLYIHIEKFWLAPIDDTLFRIFLPKMKF